MNEQKEKTEEYISREEILKRNWYGNTKSIVWRCYASELIKSIPAADVATVKHGYWIYHSDDLFPAESTQECSVCHEKEYTTLRNDHFCPNCGAIMVESL